MLLLEALVVGVASGIVGSLVALGVMSLDSQFSVRIYRFWPQVFLSFFITGIVLHLLFEAAGANSWYCKHGNACKTRDTK